MSFFNFYLFVCLFVCLYCWQPRADRCNPVLNLWLTRMCAHQTALWPYWSPAEFISRGRLRLPRLPHRHPIWQFLRGTTCVRRGKKPHTEGLHYIWMKRSVRVFPPLACIRRLEGQFCGGWFLTKCEHCPYGGRFIDFVYFKNLLFRFRLEEVFRWLSNLKVHAWPYYSLECLWRSLC